MRIKIRKMLSTLLVVSMVLSLFVAMPITASAETPPGPDDVCQIERFGSGAGYVGFETLEEALTWVETGDYPDYFDFIIFLLKDVTITGDLIVDNEKSFVINMQGFDLTITGDLVIIDSTVSFENFEDTESHLFVGNDVVATGERVYALNVHANTVATVVRDVTATGTYEARGIECYGAGAAEVNVGGDILVTTANFDSNEYIYSEAIGIDCSYGGSVAVAGNVAADANAADSIEEYCEVRCGAFGIVCREGGVVAVEGDITATAIADCTGDYVNSLARGVYCSSGGFVEVGGSVSAAATAVGMDEFYSNAIGVYCSSGGFVEVGGEVSASCNAGISVFDPEDPWSYNPTIGVYCDGALYYGPREYPEGEESYEGNPAVSQVFISGHVKSSDIGAAVSRGGQVTIDGEIDAPTYIVVIFMNHKEYEDESGVWYENYQDIKILTIIDTTIPTTKQGYRTYLYNDEGGYYGGYGRLLFQDYPEGDNEIDEEIDGEIDNGTVWVAGDPPGIDGPTEMTQTVGYAETSTGAYTLTGTTPVTATATSLDPDDSGIELKFEDGEYKLFIPAGLQVGSYAVTLIAQNALGDSDPLTFTLTVIPVSTPGPGTGPTVIIVNYNANGGTGAMATDVITNSGDDYTIKANAFTRNGYTFNGWNTKADGTGTAYAPGAVIEEVKQSITLYAQWLAKPALIKDPIRYIYGYPDGSVGPERAVTRAEAVMIFYRLLVAADKNTVYTSTFTDVKANAWYAQAIAYFEKHGLIVDSRDGKFRPNDPITRAEYAALAAGFDNLSPSAPNIFPDVADDHWAVGYINSTADKGWVAGFPDGTFKPDEALTRAQLVTIINRMLNRKLAAEDVPADVIVYTDLPETHWAYLDIVEASLDR